jgi:hypothetical protein
VGQEGTLAQFGSGIENDDGFLPVLPKNEHFWSQTIDSKATRKLNK